MAQTPVYGFTPTVGTPVSALTKRSQLVPEVTPGTTPGSPAWKRMPTLMIVPGPKLETQKFRGQGFKLPSNVIEGKEWVTFKFDGAATFGEMAYILNSYGLTVTPTTLGTTGKQWLFNPSVVNPDPVTTYSIQHGDTVRGWQMNYGQFASLTMNITRDGVKVSGDGLGQLWQTAVTLGVAPTTIENVSIMSNTCNISMDTTFGALGTTQLTGAYEIEVGLPNKFSPIFPLNTGAQGHAGTVEIATEPTVKLKLAADAQSDAFIAQIRAAGVYYTQIQIISAVQADVAAPTMYSLFWQFAIQLGEGGGFVEKDGVYVADWTQNVVVDTVNSLAWKATLINKLASL